MYKVMKNVIVFKHGWKRPIRHKCRIVPNRNSKLTEQRVHKFKEIYEPPQNSRCQKRDMKQVPH
jgi:hypothetical protein